MQGLEKIKIWIRIPGQWIYNHSLTTSSFFRNACRHAGHLDCLFQVCTIWNVSIKFCAGGSAGVGGAWWCSGRFTTRRPQVPDLGPFRVEFSCSPCACVDSLGVLLLPPTIQRHTREAIANSYLTIGVSASDCLSLCGPGNLSRVWGSLCTMTLQAAREAVAENRRKQILCWNQEQ